MAFQFVHMELYARKTDKVGRSVEWVLAEAERKPGACPHVENPQPPIVLHGVAPGDVRQLHDEACDVARVTLANGRTRSVRTDQKTLLTVVTSHPATMEQVRNDPAVSADVAAWERRAIAWLRQQYGSDLVSVVRHFDEKHAHLHAYVVPSDLRAMTLHPGATAKRAVKDAGPLDGEDAKALNRRGDAAYKEAMRGWQDSYWASVGLPSGLTRLGPGKRRLSRSEWRAEQAACKTVRIAQKKAERIDRQATAFIDRTKARASEIISAAVLKEQAAASALSRAQKEASRIISVARSEATRLASFGSGIRSLFDGLRRSSVERRARLAVSADVERERRRADESARRAADESRRRQDAEQRARDAAEAARATAAERDRARRELEFLRPDQPAPGITMGRTM